MESEGADIDSLVTLGSRWRDRGRARGVLDGRGGVVVGAKAKSSASPQGEKSQHFGSFVTAQYIFLGSQDYLVQSTILTCSSVGKNIPNENYKEVAPIIL